MVRPIVCPFLPLEMISYTSHYCKFDSDWISCGIVPLNSGKGATVSQQEQSLSFSVESPLLDTNPAAIVITCEVTSFLCREAPKTPVLRRLERQLPASISLDHSDPPSSFIPSLPYVYMKRAPQDMPPN